jgi:hypothetical protein
MNITYVAVKNPKWANSQHTMINCEVNFNHIAQEFAPFTADPNDMYNHSKEIYADCLSGAYGAIAEYTAPPTYVFTSEDNKREAIALIAETDWVNQPDVVDTANNPHLLNQADFITYRSALRKIIINPPAGNNVLPALPTAQWSS